ncbi:MAG: hypothetical protein ABFD44_03235 [Anaerolineaceae bacterium]
MTTPHERRMDILDRIARGEISAEVGAVLLRAVNSLEAEQPSEPGMAVSETPSAFQPASALPEEEVAAVRRWWLVGIWIGAAILALGAGGIVWAYLARGYNFWFYCSWLPFLLGLVVMMLASGSRKARWMYINVQENRMGGSHVRFGMPLPIGFARWVLRNFGSWFKDLKTDQREVIEAFLDAAATSSEAMMVTVDDPEDGDHVEVYLV